MKLKDWLKGLLTTVDTSLNVAQRLIQSWYSTTPLPQAKRPRLVWERDKEPTPHYLAMGGARHLWHGEWIDRSRYPGILLRTLRNWWDRAQDGKSGYELGWARQLAIGAA